MDNQPKTLIREWFKYYCTQDKGFADFSRECPFTSVMVVPWIGLHPGSSHYEEDLVQWCEQNVQEGEYIAVGLATTSSWWTLIDLQQKPSASASLVAFAFSEPRDAVLFKLSNIERLTKEA